MIAITFTYSWKLTIYVVLLIMPSLLATKFFWDIFGKYNEKYQKSKADLSAVASECFGNIRTLKAFADEEGSLIRY